MIFNKIQDTIKGEKTRQATGRPNNIRLVWSHHIWKFVDTFYHSDDQCPVHGRWQQKVSWIANVPRGDVPLIEHKHREGLPAFLSTVTGWLFTFQWGHTVLLVVHNSTRCIRLMMKMTCQTSVLVFLMWPGVSQHQQSYMVGVWQACWWWGGHSKESHWNNKYWYHMKFCWEAPCILPWIFTVLSGINELWCFFMGTFCPHK